MTEHTFGPVPTTADEPDSPLHDLIEAFAAPVTKITTVRYELPGRPGWWADFDTNFRSAKMRRLMGNGQDPDLLRVAFGVIAESCIAIGNGDTTVFASEDRPGVGRVGVFRTGQIDELLAGKVTPEPGEKAWQTSIRWALGASGDDRPLIQLASELQSANLDPVVQVNEADPTD